MGTVTKFGEIWMENGAVDGDVAARGRMSGSVDGFEEGREERSNPDKIRRKFMDGNWGEVDGKLDLPATHEIRGSNPTKLHHTNKSQKKIGAIFGGDFWIRTKNNKIKLENTG